MNSGNQYVQHTDQGIGSLELESQAWKDLFQKLICKYQSLP